MKKQILFLIFLVLFLSSCIKMNYDLVISEDYGLDGNVTIDYTKLNAYSDSLSSSFTGSTNTKKTPCESAESSSGSMDEVFTSFTCVNLDENKAQLSGKMNSLKDIIEVKDNGFYLNLNKLFGKNSLSVQDEQNSNTDETAKNQSIAMLKSMGFEIDYKISFPGKIIESNVGDFENNILDFSIYDVSQTEEPYVIFTETKAGQSNSSNYIITIDSKQEVTKKLSVATFMIDKSTKGNRDRQKFDKLIPLMKEDKIVNLLYRLSKIDKTNKIYIKNKLILDYLEARLNMELHNR
ncbi:MAG: hypothetical protein PHS49_05310 [Candidatus Gracilibacteria bacterium]|nr:hypothetical protein [Candidatus Gracilibacteria bacterium]